MTAFTGRQGKCLGVFLALIFVNAAAHAEDKPMGWTGKAGLGYLSASGNADNFNLNAVLDLGYNTELWEHSLKTLAIRAEADSIESARRYTVDLKSLREFSDRDYLFGLLAYQNDRFSGVEEQSSATVGYGRRVIDNDVHKLNVEAGLGFRKLNFQDGMSDTGAIMRLGGNYRWNFSETARFDQSLAIEAGSDNTSTESISAVTAKLYEALSLVLSLTIKNNTDVPADNTNTDRFTSISLEYAW